MTPDKIQLKLLGEKLEFNFPEILFAYLFGSQASGKSKQESDVDIAVYLLHGTKSLALVSRILSVIEEVVKQKEVDLTILNDAGVILSMEVIKGKLLFVRQDALDIHAEYYSLTCREFEDHTAWMEKQLKYRGYEVQWGD